MTNPYITYSRENGGRVILLFLLFLLALYEFFSAGYNAFTIVCISPAIVLLIYAIFRWRMLAFWTLFVVNYFLQMKDIHLPVPMSLPNEMLQILLLAVAIIDARQTPHFERVANVMLFALLI